MIFYTTARLHALCEHLSGHFFSSAGQSRVISWPHRREETEEGWPEPSSLNNTLDANTTSIPDLARLLPFFLVDATRSKQQHLVVVK